MNRINQLFADNKKDLLSIYFCAGAPTLDGTANVIRTLAANGISMISNIEQIDRGYENIEGRLTALGAAIKRIQ